MLRWKMLSRCISVAPADAQRLVTALKEKHLTIAAAESCTGGRIAAAITAVPGSSNVFPGGVVTYCDEAKNRLLEVPTMLLETQGAVSEPVAWAMARGAARIFETDLAISVTGLAGPDGDGEHPVGTVFLGLYAQGETVVEQHCFTGDREEIQNQATQRALKIALDYLTWNPK